MDGQTEALPVPFRYDLAPLASKRTIVFRPNALQGEVKHGSLGALWSGKYDQLPSNKALDIIWEAPSFVT